VAQYSDPFFDIGAGGYYANWFGDAFQKYVRYLFQGKTLAEAYEAYFDFNLTTVERHTHPDHPAAAMWLDKDFWDGKTQYNNAFVGQPEKTLDDLFGLTAMELTPSVITYLAEPSSSARRFVVRVDSTSSETFGWSASIASGAGAWVDLQPSSGMSGGQLNVVITPTGQPLGSYQVTIRLIADDPEVKEGNQTIPVTLRVLDRVYGVDLPLVIQ
jgi:hypothetical protein